MLLPPAHPGVFVAFVQQRVWKGGGDVTNVLPRRSGWIVSSQAADRRPLFFSGSQKGGGPNFDGVSQVESGEKPRLKQLGLEV